MREWRWWGWGGICGCPSQLIYNIKTNHKQSEIRDIIDPILITQSLQYKSLIRTPTPHFPPLSNLPIVTPQIPTESTNHQSTSPPPLLGQNYLSMLSLNPMSIRADLYLHNRYFTSSERAQIIATGVALAFGYLLNYACVSLIDIFGFCTLTRPDFGRRLRDSVSRHLHVFGIGCMLSVAPFQGLHGTFHAVLAWMALLSLIAMHVAYILPYDDAFGRWRVITTLVFYAVCVIWYIGITAYFYNANTY